MNQEDIRKHKKYFYLYKITNKINNKFYYGIHCTNNLNDGYMGSGKILHEAYKKYGIENFNKEIIQYCSSLEEVSNLEKEIVNEDLLNNPLCYNIIKGGYYLDEESLKSISIKNSNNQSGEKNSNFGNCWIHNLKNENKIIKNQELEYYISIGWIKGRKIKNKINIQKANKNKCWVYKDGKSHQIYKENLQEYLNKGYTKGRSKPKEYIKKEKFSWKGKVLVIDKENNRFWIDKNDERYINGEVISYNKGKIYVKDENGNKKLVDINDPKYLSGYYKSIRKYIAPKNKIMAKNINTGEIKQIDKNSEEWKSGDYVGINKGKHWKQKRDNSNS